MPLTLGDPIQIDRKSCVSNEELNRRTLGELSEREMLQLQTLSSKVQGKVNEGFYSCGPNHHLIEKLQDQLYFGAWTRLCIWLHAAASFLGLESHESCYEAVAGKIEKLSRKISFPEAGSVKAELDLIPSSSIVEKVPDTKESEPVSQSDPKITQSRWIWDFPAFSVMKGHEKIQDWSEATQRLLFENVGRELIKIMGRDEKYSKLTEEEVATVNQNVFMQLNNVPVQQWYILGDDGLFSLNKKLIGGLLEKAFDSMMKSKDPSSPREIPPLMRAKSSPRRELKSALDCFLEAQRKLLADLLAAKALPLLNRFVLAYMKGDAPIKGPAPTLTPEEIAALNRPVRLDASLSQVEVS